MDAKQELLRRAVQRERLLSIAKRLIAVPSPTGSGGAAADCLAEILREEGFTVHRPAAGHPVAPAVVTRWESGQPGRTIQFNGHLDTVHLPFVPPSIEDGLLRGSGASDMKGGMAAAVEALLILRDTGALTSGAVLLTAHDLHEAPWGYGAQLDQMIRDGIKGDGVLIPEPLCDRLPVIGRGAATWKVTIRRSGEPVHEVMRPADAPDVIGTGAELVGRLGHLATYLRKKSDPQAGHETVFVGQFHGGEIYNQYPTFCWLEGTRRWLPNSACEDVETEFRTLSRELADETGTSMEVDFRLIRDAYRLDDGPLVRSFQAAYTALADKPLAVGPKPFVDDGNSFWSLGQVPAITHGPHAGGQHTTHEWVSIDDLERVATLYALTATQFCTV